MIQAVRGMRDVLPAQARRWRHVESVVRRVMSGFAYEEVHLPLLEFTELFARGVGEATDIVEKEMYTLADRDGDSLSLRPEGTASCVRALQENGLLYNQTQKVFYAGPMFRYEKPQKGRYRQFYQIGAEVFGFPGPDVDAELILLCAQIWRELGVLEHVRLELNTLGDGGARQAYRDALVTYLNPLSDQLDPDSRRRLKTNPLRILDAKSEQTQKLLADAPQLPDFVDEASRQHFRQLCSLLEQLGINFTHNPKLVRGLDYYTHTVFEWITNDLGAQGTICAGGRYDGLVERLGGRATPAVGFAIGLDRLLLLHETVDPGSTGFADTPADVYICCPASDSLEVAFGIAQRLRAQALRVRLHMGGGNLKKQLKRANASGATWAVILGDEEVQTQTMSIKNLTNGEQQQLDLDAGVTLLASSESHG